MQIKTKIEKVFEVKPSMGVIKPGDKQVVTFKPIKKLVLIQKFRKLKKSKKWKRIFNFC